MDKEIVDMIEAEISDIIMDAAISKAIDDKRELLKPSIEHFISGGKVNGEFDIALKKLMRWVENKTIEALKDYIAGRSKNIERIENLEEFVEQFIPDPYPEDVFLPVTSDELKQIQAMLQIKFNMPLDRLAGHIGRLLRNPLRAEAKQLLTK